MTRANTNHWRKATLGEVADVNRGNTSILKSAYTEVGYPAFSGAGNDGKLPDAAYDRTGVVISAVGAYCGKTWLAKGKWSCINNTLRFFATDPEVDTEYLYWRTRNPDVWPKRGSAQPFIAMSDARAISILLPPLSEQRAIAGMLGALDDKMQHNRRTAQGTERLARAIFRAWFVDFAPVKAKIAGATSFPSVPQPVFDTLPTRFVESEIGPVPDGWEVTTFGKVLELTYGKSLKAGDRQPGSIPVYGSNGQVGWHNESVADGPGIIVGRKGNPGTVTWSQEAFFPIDTTFFVQLTESRVSLPLLFHQLQNAALGRLVSDSAVPGVNRNAIYAEQCIVPSAVILAAFDSISLGLRKLQTTLTNESGKLAEMRDYLLPKLLSGKICAEDIRG